MDAAASAVSYYQQMDGLQSNEFSDGAVWKDPQGYIFMGGIYGFNYFLLLHASSIPAGCRNYLSSARIMGGSNHAAGAFSVLKPGDDAYCCLYIGKERMGSLSST